MEIKVQVDTDFMIDLQKDLTTDTVGVMSEALTILKWVVDERKNGRIIASADADGSKVKKLSTKNIDFIKKI